MLEQVYFLENRTDTTAGVCNEAYRGGNVTQSEFLCLALFMYKAYISVSSDVSPPILSSVLFSSL